MILFDIGFLKNKIQELHSETLKENFWTDLNKSSKILSELKSYEKKITNFEVLSSNIDNLIELNNFLLLEEDEDMTKEILKSTDEIEGKITFLELQTLFKGKYDANNAIIAIHPRCRWNRISRLG